MIKAKASGSVRDNLELDELIKARFVEMFGDVIRNSKVWQIRVFADVATSRLEKCWMQNNKLANTAIRTWQISMYSGLDLILRI